MEPYDAHSTKYQPPNHHLVHNHIHYRGQSPSSPAPYLPLPPPQ